ncbi:hypothetical protein PIB30_085942 [Stylosanthes scabra]|uniref:Uncharacterized protein n=1 Tax=Stylosanthes scabra TaxID=79078 RepID=A0ABU6WSN5_9FABA|nr:hypothetical protein [Stylosanthes scabra]
MVYAISEREREREREQWRPCTADRRRRAASTAATSRLAQCSPSPPTAPHHSQPPQPPRNYANNHRSRSSIHLVRSSSSNVADPYKSAYDFKEPSLKHSVSPCLF